MKNLNKRLSYSQIFNPKLKLPTSFEECRGWFQGLASDLSPENLSCDGELTKKQVQLKYNEIWNTWAELESICKQTITLDEVESWDFDA